MELEHPCLGGEAFSNAFIMLVHVYLRMVINNDNVVFCRLHPRPDPSVRRFSRGPRSMSPSTDSRKLTWLDFAVPERQAVVSTLSQRRNCCLLFVSEV